MNSSLDKDFSKKLSRETSLCFLGPTNQQSKYSVHKEVPSFAVEGWLINLYNSLDSIDGPIPFFQFSDYFNHAKIQLEIRSLKANVHSYS